MSTHLNRKCPGLATFLADWVSGMNESVRFDCDAATAWAANFCGFVPNTKSTARALSYLVQQGKVRIAGSFKRVGDNFTVALYARGLGKPHGDDPPLPPEPSGRVKREEIAPGHTRVRFGMEWKPHSEPRAERPWRGYQSSLSAI